MRGRFPFFLQEPVLFLDLNCRPNMAFLLRGESQIESRASDLGGMSAGARRELDFDLNFNLPLNAHAVVMLPAGNLLRNPQNRHNRH